LAFFVRDVVRDFVFDVVFDLGFAFCKAGFFCGGAVDAVARFDLDATIRLGLLDLVAD
jgi:hypothetical protein